MYTNRSNTRRERCIPIIVVLGGKGDTSTFPSESVQILHDPLRGRGGGHQKDHRGVGDGGSYQKIKITRGE